MNNLRDEINNWCDSFRGKYYDRLRSNRNCIGEFHKMPPISRIILLITR